MFLNFTFHSFDYRSLSINQFWDFRGVSSCGSGCPSLHTQPISKFFSSSFILLTFSSASVSWATGDPESELGEAKDRGAVAASGDSAADCGEDVPAAAADAAVGATKIIPAPFIHISAHVLYVEFITPLLAHRECPASY